jgi:hypothetical protein
VIAGSSQEAGQRQAIGGNQRRIVATVEHAALQFRPPAVSSRQQAIPRGSANRSPAVSVGEDDSLLRKTIQIWRLDFSKLGIESLNIARA